MTKQAIEEIKGGLTEYTAIVEGLAKEYTYDATVETVRSEHSELDFMEYDEIEELLEHAKNQRNKKDQLLEIIADLEKSIQKMEKAGYHPLSKRMFQATNKLTEQKMLLRGLK